MCNCSVCARGRIADTKDDEIIIDGIALKDMERIGGGAYSVAYRHGDTVYLITSAQDYTRLAIARECYHIKNPHIPKLKELPCLADGRMVFRMPYYQNVSDVKNACDSVSRLHDSRARGGYKYGMDGALVIARDKKLPKPLRAAFYKMAKVITRWSKNGDGWITDLCDMNCSVDDAGNLVLRDCFAP